MFVWHLVTWNGPNGQEFFTEYMTAKSQSDAAYTTVVG